MLVYDDRGGVPASTPKDYLIAHARDFDLDPLIIARFDQPMLVRTVKESSQDPQVLAAWSRRLNVSLTQGLDPIDLAVSRAKGPPQNKSAIFATTGLRPDCLERWAG